MPSGLRSALPTSPSYLPTCASWRAVDGYMHICRQRYLSIVYESDEAAHAVALGASAAPSAAGAGAGAAAGTAAILTRRFLPNIIFKNSS